jgi:hypothetical protein
MGWENGSGDNGKKGGSDYREAVESFVTDAYLKLSLQQLKMTYNYCNPSPIPLANLTTLRLLPKCLLVSP